VTGTIRHGMGVASADDPPLDVDHDEAPLVARAQRDPAAFAPLYACYLGPVYGYCYTRLGDRAAAEDATSAVFARALAALPRYRAGSFRGWLFTIAHNVVADAFRGRRPEGPLDAAAEVADAAPTPEERAVADDAGRYLRAQFAHLTPDQRQVVELRLAGLNDREIAQALGRSHGAVRMSQLRAVARLRALLGVDATPTPPEEGPDADA
jgi:RNA polymerase sigma-70 factor (ECF subfamily)